MKSKFGNDKFYQGTAEFGKDFVMIKTVITMFIMVITVSVGIWMIRRKPVYTVPAKMSNMVSVYSGINPDSEENLYNTTGFVIDPSGNPLCGKNPVPLVGTYQDYTNKSNIDVWIQNKCKNADAHVSTDDLSGIGWTLIFVSVIIILFSLLNWYFVKKYKGLAAFEGIAGVFNLFKNS